MNKSTAFMIGGGVLLLGGLALGLYFKIRKNGAEDNSDKEVLQEEPVSEKKHVIYKESHEKPDIYDYAKKVEAFNYATPITAASEEKVKKEPKNEYPDHYVIDAREFGASDYDEVTLTYYDDGILAEGKEALAKETIERIVGDILENPVFQLDGVIYVRNDRLRIDYEVITDHRDFSEVE